MNLSCNERNFLDPLLRLAVFSLAVTFHCSRRVCPCMETWPSAASFCRSHFRYSHLPQLFARSFPSTHSMSFQNLQLCLDCKWIPVFNDFFFFPTFSDLVDLQYWGWLHFRFHCSLTLFPVCFYRVSSILLAPTVI